MYISTYFSYNIYDVHKRILNWGNVETLRRISKRIGSKLRGSELTQMRSRCDDVKMCACVSERVSHRQRCSPRHTAVTESVHPFILQGRSRSSSLITSRICWTIKARRSSLFNGLLNINRCKIIWIVRGLACSKCSVHTALLDYSYIYLLGAPLKASHANPPPAQMGPVAPFYIL